MSENQTEKPAQKPLPWKWIFIATAILLALKWTVGGNSNDKGNCDCEYKDDFGNRKRIHAGSYRDCIDLYHGKSLGTGASCEVTRYNEPW